MPPFLVSLVVIGGVFAVTPLGRAGRIGAAAVWVMPVTASFGNGSALWFQPHPAIDMTACSIFAVAQQLGIGTGMLRADGLELRCCPMPALC